VSDIQNSFRTTVAQIGNAKMRAKYGDQQVSKWGVDARNRKYLALVTTYTDEADRQSRANQLLRADMLILNYKSQQARKAKKAAAKL